MIYLHRSYQLGVRQIGCLTLVATGLHIGCNLISQPLMICWAHKITTCLIMCCFDCCCCLWFNSTTSHMAAALTVADCVYCSGGSEAVDNAVKIARAVTGRPNIIAFDVSV
jgi:hypothetical protein